MRHVYRFDVRTELQPVDITDLRDLQKYIFFDLSLPAATQSGLVDKYIYRPQPEIKQETRKKEIL